MTEQPSKKGPWWLSWVLPTGGLVIMLILMSVFRVPTYIAIGLSLLPWSVYTMYDAAGITPKRFILGILPILCVMVVFAIIEVLQFDDSMKGILMGITILILAIPDIRRAIKKP